MLKWRSVRSIVIPPARTGSEISSKNAVIKTAQGNNGIRYIYIPRVLMLKIVTIKLIAPAIELIPAMCNEKIPKSTDGPGW